MAEPPIQINIQISSLRGKSSLNPNLSQRRPELVAKWDQGFKTLPAFRQSEPSERTSLTAKEKNGSIAGRIPRPLHQRPYTRQYSRPGAVPVQRAYNSRFDKSRA